MVFYNIYRNSVNRAFHFIKKGTLLFFLFFLAWQAGDELIELRIQFQFCDQSFHRFKSENRNEKRKKKENQKLLTNNSHREDIDKGEELSLSDQLGTGLF